MPKKFKCGERKKKSKGAKRKLVKNRSKNTSLKKGHDLRGTKQLKVAKEDFGPVGALLHWSFYLTLGVHDNHVILCHMPFSNSDNQ
jgi:hypothetical protein